MAKTTFVDGTSTIWASFMNSIFNTDGGHKHDGGTDDGSAGKVNPKDHVDWADMSLDVAEDAINDAVEGIDYHVIDLTTTAAGDGSGIKTDRGYFDSLRAKTSVIIAQSFQFLDERVRSAGRFKIRNAADSAFQDMECDRLYAANATLTGTVSCEDTLVDSRSMADLAPYVVVHALGRGTAGSCTINSDADSRISVITRTGSTGGYIVNLNAPGLGAFPRPILITCERSGFCHGYVTSWVDSEEFAIQFKNDSGSSVDPDAFTIVIWDV